jgi:hypothetical protein
MPILPVLGRLRQEDHEFQYSLARPCHKTKNINTKKRSKGRSAKSTKLGVIESKCQSRDLKNRKPKSASEESLRQINSYNNHLRWLRDSIAKDFKWQCTCEGLAKSQLRSSQSPSLGLTW